MILHYSNHLGHGLTFQQTFIPLPPPNDRYAVHRVAAAQRFGIQNDHTQDFYYQHARRMNDAREYLHQSQFIDWASNSDTRVDSSAGVSRDEPQYLSDLPDESRRQIIYSDSYPNRLDPGLNIFGHTISLENEAGLPIPFADMSEDGNYTFRAMVESEEEYSPVIFDVASEEERTDDERGFEGDDEDSDGSDEHGDEDSDSRMDLGEDGDEGVEVAEEDGEDMHMQEEVSFIRVSRRAIFDQNSLAIFHEEEIWEVEWPSGAWQSAFNRREYN